MSVNKVILIGNLGKDPELKRTSYDNTAVVNFSIATTEKYTDKAGNSKDKTEWHNIIVWNKQAENCAKYLTKGSPVYIEGKLQTRSWEDKEGNKKYTTEIVANKVQFLSNKKENQNNQQFSTNLEKMPF